MFDFSELLQAAAAARKAAYCPYSGYAVGAALLGKSGRIYPGCNVENAALSAICAERAALTRAVTDGEQTYTAIAIVGGPRNKPAREACFPCGVCRQMLYEFGGDTMQVIVGLPDDYQVYTLGQLLPFAFGPDMLKDTKANEGSKQDQALADDPMLH